MSQGRKALLRVVAPVAVLALSLTACGSDDSSDDKADGKKSSSSAGGTEQGSDTAKDEKPDTPAGPMKMGETAPGVHEYDMSDGKAKLEITAESVSKGENKDLLAAGLKGDDVKGMYPVFVKFTYTVKEGGKLDDPGFNRKARVLGEGKKPGKSLIAIGADPIPGGCPEADELKWKVGDSNTMCSTFLLPEGTGVEQVAWAGDLRNPLIWNA